MSSTTIVDPAPPPSGSLLVFDISSFSSTRLYLPESDKTRPTFTIRSENDSKHRFVHFGLDGGVAGEVVFHGRFKRGKGTVSIAGAEPVAIEDWMIDAPKGRGVVIHDASYVWIQRPIQLSKNMFQDRFEVRYTRFSCLLDSHRAQAWRDDKVVATYVGSHVDSHFSPYNQTQAAYDTPRKITRAHIIFADDLETEKATPTLLLSLIVFQHLERSAKPGEHMFNSIDVGMQ
jgi:hypothetical protein